MSLIKKPIVVPRSPTSFLAEELPPTPPHPDQEDEIVRIVEQEEMEYRARAKKKQREENEAALARQRASEEEASERDNPTRPTTGSSHPSSTTIRENRPFLPRWTTDAYGRVYRVEAWAPEYGMAFFLCCFLFVDVWQVCHWPS